MFSNVTSTCYSEKHRQRSDSFSLSSQSKVGAESLCFAALGRKCPTVPRCALLPCSFNVENNERNPNVWKFWINHMKSSLARSHFDSIFRHIFRYRFVVIAIPLTLWGFSLFEGFRAKFLVQYLRPAPWRREGSRQKRCNYLSHENFILWLSSWVLMFWISCHGIAKDTFELFLTRTYLLEESV